MRSFTAAAIGLTTLAALVLSKADCFSDYLGDLDHQSISRNALWHVVHDLCGASEKLGLAFPCTQIEPAKNGTTSGWAILEVGRDHMLTTPTRKVSGIESPLLFEPDFPNLWQAAWSAQKYMASVQSGRVARERIAVVVNSIRGRSQDQLHIHTSCLRPDIASSLSQNMQRLTSNWSRMPVALHGVHYLAKVIEGPDLSAANLFHDIPAARNGYSPLMGLQTIIAVGARLANGHEGFIILNDQAHGSDSGHGEVLLDMECLGT